MTVERPPFTAPTPGADPEGYVLHVGEGQHIWFEGALMSYKAKAADNDGQAWIFEVECLQGWGAPVHRHSYEAEWSYILEGDIDFTINGKYLQAGAGSIVYIPRMAEHSLVTQSKKARMLGFVTPGGFEGFFEKLGEPATVPSPPTHPTHIAAFQELVELAGEYGLIPISPEAPHREGGVGLTGHTA